MSSSTREPTSSDSDQEDRVIIDIEEETSSTRSQSIDRTSDQEDKDLQEVIVDGENTNETERAIVPISVPHSLPQQPNQSERVPSPDQVAAHVSYGGFRAGIVITGEPARNLIARGEKSLIETLVAPALYRVCRDVFCWIIRKIRGGSVKVDVVIESKEDAKRFLHLLVSGELEKLINEDLDEHSDEADSFKVGLHPCELDYYRHEEVSREELESIKKSATELRAQYEERLQVREETSRKRSGSVVKGESTAAKRRAHEVTLIEREEEQSALSLVQTSQAQLELKYTEVAGTKLKDHKQRSSLKLEDVLDNAFELKDAYLFLHQSNFSKVSAVMDKDLIALRICYVIQYYCDVMTVEKYEEIPDVVKKLAELVKDNVPTSAQQLLSFARKLKAGSRLIEASLFFEIASSFFEQEKVLNNVADGIADCVQGLTFICAEMMSSDSQEDTAISKPFVKAHIVPVMRDMVDKIIGVQDQDRVPWCLHYMECALSLVDDWNYREKIILEALEQMRKRGNEEAEKQKIYGNLLSNLGNNYEQTSQYDLAKDHYQRALDAYKKAQDMDLEEENINLKRCEKNIHRVSELFSLEYK